METLHNLEFGAQHVHVHGHIKTFFKWEIPSNTANIIVFSQAYLVIFHKSNVPSELTVVDVKSEP